MADWSRSISVTSETHSAPNALIYSFRRRATVAHSNSDTIPVSTVVNTLYV